METGKMTWFDFGTKDEKKAMAFYKKVLGWEFEPMGPDYWMCKVGGQTIGGIRKDKTFKPSVGFVPYFIVPSVKEGNTVVTKAGGKLVNETVAINDGEMGYFQWFTDLDGNTMALWSQKP